MEKISNTEDEDDLLELYGAVLRTLFNDRITARDEERVDITGLIQTFKTVTEIVDKAVNEKIRDISVMLGGAPEETGGSVFDQYDRENGYIEETSQEEIWESYRENLDTVLQICIKNMRNSYKECLESDLSDLLDYVMFQVEYDRGK